MTEVSDFFSLFDGPALVATAQSDAGRSGCLVAFATQCSIYPPRLLVCLSVVNLTTTIASLAPALGIHVLRRDQLALASRFGEATGDDTDKLGDVAWREGLAGAHISRAIGQSVARTAAATAVRQQRVRARTQQTAVIAVVDVLALRRADGREEFLRVLLGVTTTMKSCFVII